MLDYFTITANFRYVILKLVSAPVGHILPVAFIICKYIVSEFKFGGTKHLI